MGLITKSFFLSFGVLGRMFFPTIAIFVAFSFVWSMLGYITAGYADYVSGPITTTFISLFGIRVALSLMGDRSRTGYDSLAVYSVLFGVFFILAKGSALLLSDVIAVVFADWSLGDAISLRNFKSAEESLQFLFTFQAIGAKVVVSLVMYTAVSVVMAVPLANAARSAGQGKTSVGFFTGIGRSFVPLFIIFIAAFFVQFFFNFITALFAIFPLVLAVFSIVFLQTVPDIDLGTVITGLAASAGLLWIHCLVWSASAVALLESDKNTPPPSEGSPAERVAPVNFQALRKSREAGVR